MNTESLLMWFKQCRCNHSYRFERSYGMELGRHTSVWYCEKCGKTVERKHYTTPVALPAVIPGTVDPYHTPRPKLPEHYSMVEEQLKSYLEPPKYYGWYVIYPEHKNHANPKDQLYGYDPLLAYYGNQGNYKGSWFFSNRLIQFRFAWLPKPGPIGVPEDYRCTYIAGVTKEEVEAEYEGYCRCLRGRGEVPLDFSEVARAMEKDAQLEKDGGGYNRANFLISQMRTRHWPSA